MIAVVLALTTPKGNAAASSSAAELLLEQELKFDCEDQPAPHAQQGKQRGKQHLRHRGRPCRQGQPFLKSFFLQ